MITKKTASNKTEKSLVERLAARVQELYLEAQAALPADRPKINALYREAYLIHRRQKAFVGEQNLLLAVTSR